MHAYAKLFDAGYAHSFEVWNERGELVGGGYGIGVGGAFATESQFSREPNTSKIGFTMLNWHLAHWGYAFNDGKIMTPTCRDMGFREIPRAESRPGSSQAERRPGRNGQLAGRGRRYRGRRLAAGIIDPSSPRRRGPRLRSSLHVGGGVWVSGLPTTPPRSPGDDSLMQPELAVDRLSSAGLISLQCATSTECSGPSSFSCQNSRNLCSSGNSGNRS